MTLLEKILSEDVEGLSPKWKDATIQYLACTKQINTTSYVAVDTGFASQLTNKTTPASKEQHVMKVVIDASAIAQDGDVLVALALGSAAKREILLAEGVNHLELNYPITQTWAATQNFAVRAKCLGANVDKTINVHVWLAIADA